MRPIDHLKGIIGLSVIFFLLFSKRKEDGTPPPTVSMAASITQPQQTKSDTTTVINIEDYHQFQINYFKEHLPATVPQYQVRYYLSEAYLMEVQEAYLNQKK